MKVMEQLKIFLFHDDESKRYDTSGEILPNVKILISKKKFLLKLPPT